MDPAFEGLEHSKVATGTIVLHETGARCGSIHNPRYHERSILLTLDAIAVSAAAAVAGTAAIAAYLDARLQIRKDVKLITELKRQEKIVANAGKLGFKAFRD